MNKVWDSHKSPKTQNPKYHWTFMEYVNWYMKNGLSDLFDPRDCAQYALLNIIKKPERKRKGLPGKEEHGSPREVLFKYLLKNKMPPKGSPVMMYLRQYLHWQKMAFLGNEKKKHPFDKFARKRFWEDDPVTPIDQIPTYDEPDIY